MGILSNDDLFFVSPKQGAVETRELGSLKDDKLRKYDNCLPDDLILSLKQAEQPREYLGPPSKKAVAGIKPTIPVGKHLLENLDLTTIWSWG